MALSRELIRRLNTEEEPLAKRLKLAENIFTSEDAPLTRKENLVLEWLCRAAENTENTSGKDVWCTLARCFSSADRFGKVFLKTGIKQSFISALVQRLSASDLSELDEPLRCCELIFQRSEMRRYFQSDPGLLCRALEALLSLLSAEYASRCSSEEKDIGRKIDSRLMKCLISGIECLVICHKRSSTKEKTVDLFIESLLYPLCNVADRNLDEVLAAATRKCIARLIFGKSTHSAYRDYEGRESDNFASRVYAGLRKKAEASKEDDTVVVFAWVLGSAIDSYKTDPATVDSIFRNLIDSAYGAKIKVLARIGEQLKNVTFDYENKIGDSTLFQYLQEFIDEITSFDFMDAASYEALQALTILNPLVVERKLPNILGNILLENKKTAKDMNSYRDLMISIIDAGVRLRSEQKLIARMLKAIEDRLIEKGACPDLRIEAIFPIDFKTQFSKSVGNMTSTQTIGVFRTLVFHLNNCIEIKDEKVAALLLQANVELMSAYFEGVRIFDYSVPRSGQDKFVRALEDLGKKISSLTDKIFADKSNEQRTVALFTLIRYWDNIYNCIKYYAPDVVPKELDFPTSETRMRKIIENINDVGCERAMNMYLIQQIGRNIQDASSLDLSSILGGLENSWSIILDQSPQILSRMKNSEIVELSSFLLDEARSSNADASESTLRLSLDCVQNDERFAKTLVYRTLVNMAMSVSESTTKRITSRVNVAKILKRGNIEKMIREVKMDLMKKEWIFFNEEAEALIEKDLKILSRLPLEHLDLELRTLLVLVVYCIKKECKGNGRILDLCTRIALDASEKLDIDIIDFLAGDLFIDELASDSSVQRVIESSLRNVSTWETLKVLIKKIQANGVAASIFLECLERVRPKLKNDAREVFRKAEIKLTLKLLEGIDGKLNDSDGIGRLTLGLKLSIAHVEVSDNLMVTIKSTLNRIFLPQAAGDKKIVARGLHLASLVLKQRGKFEFDEQLLNNIWQCVLDTPTKEIVQSLLERSEPKALMKLFGLLHAKTIEGLVKSDENCFTNVSMIWESVTSVQMGGARQKIRAAALNDLLRTLLISKIPTEFWPAVLKLAQSTLPESLHVMEKGLDLVTLLAGRSLREAELSACEDVLAICGSLVKFNGGTVVDRLPVLLALYRELVRLVVRESRKENTPSRQRLLGCLALDVEKFTNALVKLKKDLARISPYVIADLVEIFSEGAITSRIKGPLEDCVGHFFSISDQHAISLLSRALPAGTQGIFKTLYETYNKFYKFTGRI